MQAGTVRRTLLMILCLVLLVPLISLGQSPSYWADIFSSTQVNPLWQWENETPAGWSLTDNPGHLRIYTASGGFLGTPPPPKNVLLTSIGQELDCQLDVHMYFEPSENFQYAGVIFYNNPDDFLAFGRAYCNYTEGGCVGDGLYIDHEESGVYQPQPAIVPWFGEDIYLRVVRIGSTYTFYASSDGSQWTTVATKHGVALRPAYVGIYAVNATEEAGSIPADFDYFRISPPH